MLVGGLNLENIYVVFYCGVNGFDLNFGVEMLVGKKC